ncbi:hypothetical protein M0L20_07660 [Spirosoma sp. RP8]|uniref:Prolyl oligopeptidase family serine peptidase n=1 Tax=Spirosoma liriopis TaxID=2937440 RepID=A0ABT0HI94_9BACT|nr:hypothetical protein [Spirosoma liriopis]MCK8491725.1 hypothetical protein [Spirosoma liriopis]
MRKTLLGICFCLVVHVLKAQLYEQQIEKAAQAINKKDFCAALLVFKQALTDTTKVNRYDYAYAALAAANCHDQRQALTWLNKSQQKGFGLQDGEIESIAKDSAFSSLHTSAEWRILLAKMQQAKEKDKLAKQIASEQWLESSLRHAQLTESEGGMAKPFPAGFALYFQPADTINVPYLVYVPSSFSRAKPASLIIYLHGGVVNQDHFAYRDPQVANEPIFKVANHYNTLVLYPFARKDFGWVDQENAFKHVLTMLDQVKKRYAVPFDRIYLGGMSNGGTATYWYATKHAHLFSGFYAFSPWPSLKSSPTDYAKLSSGKPFVSINAKDDSVFPYSAVKAIYDQQQSKARDWRFKSIAEGGHGFIYEPGGPLLMQEVFDELFREKH